MAGFAHGLGGGARLDLDRHEREIVAEGQAAGEGVDVGQDRIDERLGVVGVDVQGVAETAKAVAIASG